jgi:cobalamin synthase
VKGFRKFKARWGRVIVLVFGLIVIAGFHNVPALWVPMAAVFLIGWILGERSDRRRQAEQKRK